MLRFAVRGAATNILPPTRSTAVLKASRLATQTFTQKIRVNPSSKAAYPDKIKITATKRSSARKVRLYDTHDTSWVRKWRDAILWRGVQMDWYTHHFSKDGKFDYHLYKGLYYPHTYYPPPHLALELYFCYAVAIAFGAGTVFAAMYYIEEGVEMSKKLHAWMSAPLENNGEMIGADGLTIQARKVTSPSPAGKEGSA